MKKVTTVASVVRLEATAELKKEVELELAVADPQVPVDLKQLKEKYDSAGRND